MPTFTYRSTSELFYGYIEWPELGRRRCKQVWQPAGPANLLYSVGEIRSILLTESQASFL